MEQDLITILVVILIVLLTVAIIYRIFVSFLQPSEARKSKIQLEQPILIEQKDKVDEEYKKIIEKSKSELKSFMEKQNELR